MVVFIFFLNIFNLFIIFLLESFYKNLDVIFRKVTFDLIYIDDYLSAFYVQLVWNDLVTPCHNTQRMFIIAGLEITSSFIKTLFLFFFIYFFSLTFNQNKLIGIQRTSWTHINLRDSEKYIFMTFSNQLCHKNIETFPRYIHSKRSLRFKKKLLIYKLQIIFFFFHSFCVSFTIENKKVAVKFTADGYMCICSYRTSW